MIKLNRAGKLDQDRQFTVGQPLKLEWDQIWDCVNRSAEIEYISCSPNKIKLAVKRGTISQTKFKELLMEFQSIPKKVVKVSSEDVPFTLSKRITRTSKTAAKKKPTTQKRIVTQTQLENLKIVEGIGPAIEKLLKSKEIGEDEEKSSEKNVQTITDDHIKVVDEKVSLKEKEIMTI